MAIPYPSNPVSGDTFTDNGITYTWSGVAWISTFTRTPDTGTQGPQGETGPTGATGVVTATAPVTYNSGTQTVGIDQAGITLAQSQVTSLVSDLSDKATFNHAHGYIGNTGTLATPVTATNPVKVVITNSSDTVGTLTTTGASGTTFLRGDGTWASAGGNGFVGSFQTTAASSSSAVSLTPASVSTTPASDISIIGGATTNTTGNAGEVYITGGASTTGTGLSSGGNVAIRGGATNTTQGAGGSVTINGGQGSNANGNGSISIGTLTTAGVTVAAPLSASRPITLTTNQEAALTINNVDSDGIVINSEIDGEYYSSRDIIQANVSGTRTFAIDSSGNAFFGGGQGVQSNAVVSPTTYLSLTSSSGAGISVNDAATVGLNNGGNVSFFPYTQTNYQSGNRILFIGNRLTEPTGSPVSGGFVYVDAGALKYRGTSGSAATIVNANGTQTAPTATAKHAANRTTSVTGTTALAVNTQETFAITFPASRFSVAPAVTASTNSPRYVAAVSGVTTSGFSLIVRNVSDATGTTYLYHWQAIEIVAGMGN
jgi:collagen type VII alpha